MVAFTYRMPAGINGATNRQHDATVEGQIIMAANPPLFYGSALVMDTAAGQVRPPIAGDVLPGAVYGFYVRPWPTQASQDPLGTDTPPTNGSANVLKRGYMTVLLRGGNAVKGAPVAVGTGAAGNPGGIYAAGEPNSTPLTNAYFMGPADSNDYTEIAYNL